MRSIAVRSAFAATLCAGVGMVGVSVHGLLGVDAELERSALAAAKQRPAMKHVFTTTKTRDGNCPATAPARERV
jgi:hypothetical protein